MAQAVLDRPGLDGHIHPGTFSLFLQKLRGNYIHSNLFIIKATEATDCMAFASKTPVNFPVEQWGACSLRGQFLNSRKKFPALSEASEKAGRKTEKSREPLKPSEELP